LSNPVNRQTDRHGWKHHLLGRGNYTVAFQHNTSHILVFAFSSKPGQSVTRCNGHVVQ